MMIVVTGATGNVGGTLARLLAEAAQEVTAVSRRLLEGDPPDVGATAGARGIQVIPSPDADRPPDEGRPPDTPGISPVTPPDPGTTCRMNPNA